VPSSVTGVHIRFSHTVLSRGALSVTLPDRPTRIVISAAIFVSSGIAWFMIALYVGLDLLGNRTPHPVVELFGWIALAVAGVAALVCVVEVASALLVWLRRWQSKRSY
jgi:hypothetical protein